MHSLRRATSRLACPSLTTVPAVISRSRYVAPLQYSSPRLSLQLPFRATLQTRWNSHTPDNERQLPESLKPLEESPEYPPLVADEAEQADISLPQGKRQARHEQVDAFSQVPLANETVYIGNLFYDLTADDLRKHMEKYGTVLKTYIVHDARGISKGFGYVEFSSVDGAWNAIQNLHMQVLEGRQVVLQYARSQLKKRTYKTAPSNTLYIGGIPYECSDRDLQDMFKDIQNVVDVRIPVDRRSGQIRGFAHAEFLNVQSAEIAKPLLKNLAPYGKRLQVHFAEHKRVGVMVGESDRNRALEAHREREREEREKGLEKMESQMEDRFHRVP